MLKTDSKIICENWNMIVEQKLKAGYKKVEGALPKGWTAKRLKEVIKNIGDGGTPSRSKEEYFVGHIPWAVVEDIKREILDTKEHLSDKGLKYSSAKLWPENSVILSFGATIGEVGIARVPVATKQGIAGIVPNPEYTTSEFLYYLLKFNKNLLIRYSHKSTIAEVRPPTLVELAFPFPPLVEQQKIASIVWSVDEAIQKAEETIAKAQELKKALMQQLLIKGIGHKKFKKTKIGEIPEEWEVVKLGDVLVDIRYGTSTKSNTAKQGFPVLRTPNVLSGEIDINDLQWVQLPESEMKSLILEDGDLLTVRTNANPDYIGRCALFERMSGTWTYASYLIRLRPNKKKVVPTYLGKYLGTKTARRGFFRIARTSAGNYNINTKRIKSISIPLPPLHEQQEIVEILQVVDENIKKEKQRKYQHEILKKGLMQDLLTGKVRVKVN